MKKVLLAVSLVLILAACQKSNQVAEPQPQPAKVVLGTPHQNPQYYVSFVRYYKETDQWAEQRIDRETGDAEIVNIPKVQACKSIEDMGETFPDPDYVWDTIETTAYTQYYRHCVACPE